MKKIFQNISYYLLSLILFSNCVYQKNNSYQNTQKLFSKDRMILQQLDSLEFKFKNGKMDSLQFKHALSVLSEQEDSLFGIVRSIRFERINEYNYWHRGRLKFPSRIKILLNNMNKSNTDTMIKNLPAKK